MDKALDKSTQKIITWERLDENKDFCIFKNDPTKDNIKQSKNIKDCYFLSALGTLCIKDKINVIKNLFHITEITKEKVYGIYFYVDGNRQLILIDDFLPYQKKIFFFFFI